jgi:soluble lytic murein transglycosylase
MRVARYILTAASVFAMLLVAVLLPDRLGNEDAWRLAAEEARQASLVVSRIDEAARAAFLAPDSADSNDSVPGSPQPNPPAPTEASVETPRSIAHVASERETKPTVSAAPVAPTSPILAKSSPLAAIDALIGPPPVSADSTLASGEAKTGVAVPYAAPDAPNAATPSVFEPILPGASTWLGAPAARPTPGETSPTTAGKGDPPAPAQPDSVPPGDIMAAKLAVAAYSQGDMAQGDQSAAAVMTEAGRVALEWMAIRFDPRGTGYARIISFLKAHPGWPSAPWLRKRAEESLYAADKQQGLGLLTGYFANAKPESPFGRLALARLYRKQGRDTDAASLARDVWREADLSAPLESRLIGEFGDLLAAADHKFRADRAFYKEDGARLMRAAALVGGDEVALAKAQLAVVNEAGNAETLLAAVPAKLKTDPSFTFARIQHLRRANKPDKLVEATKLMLSAPREADQLVDGDAWWVERRLIARKLLDAGDLETAYQICAEHGASSPELRIEAEFHAGWIALRFLKNPALAVPHFTLAAAIATTPVSIARAAYWQGRTAEVLGDEPAATVAYRRAADQVTTYYGQLARTKLGLTDLPLRQVRQAATGDERNLAVRVAEFLYAIGEGESAFPIIADAGKYLDDEAQMAALGKVVEASGDARATLALGKLATQRGLALDDIAFPTFGVPNYEPLGKSADRTVVYAIARQESAFAQTATSTAGAKGLMQLMPDTARRAAQHAGIPLDMAKLNTDGSLNARIGAFHLGELFAEQGGSYILAFAAYNAGGKRVKEWIDSHGDPRKSNVDPVDWVEAIPITETRDYVQRVIENLQVYRARFGDGNGMITEAQLRHGGGG